MEAIKKIIGEPRNYGIDSRCNELIIVCCNGRTHTRGEGTNGGRGEKREGVYSVR